MPLKFIDSSTLPQNSTNHRWAKFRKTKAGVKLHLRLVFMEKGRYYPEKAVLINALEHDRNQLEVLNDNSVGQTEESQNQRSEVKQKNDNYIDKRRSSLFVSLVDFRGHVEIFIVNDFTFLTKYPTLALTGYNHLIFRR